LDVLLPQIIEWKGTVTRSGQMLLGGFTLGLLANESNSDVEWNKLFLEHITPLTTLQPRILELLGLSTNVCTRLAEN
jgi:hypothetical protein